MAKKPLEIDMCGGSQLRDTQGEMLSVEGADIAELEAGRGRFNDNHGKGFFNSIGRITAAKKIFKREDCDDDRQRYYWDKVKAPYIYVRGFMHDDEDHPNARAAAAILRNVHKVDCPLKIKASVEGGVISRGIADPSLLARTKIHSIALTFTPANTATLVEPLNLDKSIHDEIADINLIKSVIHLAQTDVPSFRHIVRDASANKIVDNIEKIADLIKQEGTNIHVPSKQDILQYALEAKIRNNVAKIKEVVEVIKEEELGKGLKDKVAGAMIGGAAALGVPSSTPTHVDQPKAIVQQQQQRQQPKQMSQAPMNLSRMPGMHQQAYKSFASKNPLLGAIGMVESSGGLNYAHKGRPNTAAAGMFGMKPVAAQYILRNSPELAKKYPDLAKAAENLGANGHIIRNRLNSDPQAAYDLASALLGRYKSKTKDINMLIHAWNHGLKGTWDRYKNEGEDAIRNADYVKKVLGHLPKHGMNKALTAGYGGAGVPTGLTRGGVVQSESLEGQPGRKDFKYITCLDCGKEQVYSKYQVKCRECGSSFPMERLHKLFLGAIAT